MSEGEGPLFHHLRVELGQGAPQQRLIHQASQSSDEPIQSWREDDQVSARFHDPVGMRQPGRDKDRGPGRGVHLAVLEPKVEGSF